MQEDVNFKESGGISKSISKVRGNNNFPEIWGNVLLSENRGKILNS